MDARGKKYMVIYLEDWQIRMVRDLLGKECHTWTIELDSAPAVGYGVVPPVDQSGNPKAKRMYLTDWQQRQIQEEVRVRCAYIELEKDTHTRDEISPEGPSG